MRAVLPPPAERATPCPGPDLAAAFGFRFCTGAWPARRYAGAKIQPARDAVLLADWRAWQAELSFLQCDLDSGKPYCEEHAAIAYVRVRDRREDAA